MNDYSQVSRDEVFVWHERLSCPPASVQKRTSRPHSMSLGCCEPLPMSPGQDGKGFDEGKVYLDDREQVLKDGGNGGERQGESVRVSEKHHAWQLACGTLKSRPFLTYLLCDCCGHTPQSHPCLLSMLSSPSSSLHLPFSPLHQWRPPLAVCGFALNAGKCASLTVDLRSTLPPTNDVLALGGSLPTLIVSTTQCSMVR